MRRQIQTGHALLRAIGGLVLVLAALSVQAQGSPATAPSLPPAPTPTEQYPGVGMSSSYTSPSGITLLAWQTLYLPIQSHLYQGDINPRTGKPAEVPLSAYVSIRNTDPRASLRVTSARYYNAEGQLLREFLPKPQSVPPLGTYELHIPRTNAAGTNFIIVWNAERPINPPQVEAVHSDGRALFFVTGARSIEPR